MGNDNVFSTEDINTIQMTLNDRIMRYLQDVRYIPDLKKNLISLGDLESKCEELEP